MVWHSIEELGDSYAATKRLLLPFSLKRWIVLGIVVFFVSGTTGMNPSAGVSLPSFEVDRDVSEFPVGEFPEDEWAWNGAEAPSIEGIAEGTAGATAIAPIEALLALAIVGTVVLLGILALYVAAVMEFVFVRITASESVRIRGFFGESTRKGLSLLLFQIAIAATILGIILSVFVLTVLTGGLFLVLVVLLSPVLILAVVALWLLLRFTIDFVVPVMLVEDVGIVDGWRRFAPAMRDEWQQYGAYAGVRLVLGVVASTITGIGAAAIAVGIGIPFALVGIVGFVLLGAIAPGVGIVFGVGMVVLFALAVLVGVTVFVLVPIRTYLRYYGLFVLGSITPRFDMVEEIRTVIASAESEPSGAEDDPTR